TDLDCGQSAANKASVAPSQSYSAADEPSPETRTSGHEDATAAITDRLPVRESCGPPKVPPVRTQRTSPARTRLASQPALTSLSRPEKPPRAATSLPVITAVAAPCW